MSARRITSFFFRKASSVRPAPRPVSSSGARPVNAARTAADVVVLPIPISPMPTACIPSCAARCACSMPTEMAVSACSRVMAGSRAISPVERRIFRFTISGQRTSASMPTSVTTTESPKAAARADMPVICRVILID